MCVTKIQPETKLERRTEDVTVWVTDQFYYFPGNTHHLGYPRSIDVDQWWDSLGEARQSARDFLKDWGCD